MVILERSRDHIQDLISGRPRLKTLEDGWHIRNTAEVQDIARFADWVTPSMYFGIAGGRLGGKILIPFDKLLPGDRYRYKESIGLSAKNVLMKTYI